MTALFIFEGYTLYLRGCSYKSLIDDKWIAFDRAVEWYRYIKKLKKIK